MFRWGKILVFILVFFSAADCAKRQNFDSLFQYGYTYDCHGPIGNFVVGLSRQGGPSEVAMYELDIQPLDVPQPGTLVHVAIASGATAAGGYPQYRDLIPSTTLQRGQIIKAALLTRDDINIYPNLIIVPYDGNSDPTFLNNSASSGAICSIPTQDALTGQSI